MKCKCGHDKLDHNTEPHDGGECFAKITVGNNRDFCPCDKFEEKIL